MSISTKTLLLVSGLLSSSSALAANAPWTIVLSNATTIDQDKSVLPDQTRANELPGASASLTIECPDEATCDPNNLEVKLGTGVVPPSRVDQSKKRQYTLQLTGPGLVVLEVFSGSGPKTRILHASLEKKAASNPGITETPTLDGTPLSTFLTVNCSQSNTPVGWPGTERDASDKNRRILVTVAGDVLLDPLQNVNEGDTVEVSVVAPQEIISFVRVVRKSPTRTTGSLSILGAGSLVPIAAQKSGLCAVKTFMLSDFAAGTGKIEIQVITQAGQTTSGQLEFPVNTLYSGMFSFGVIWSNAVEPNYKLVSRGQDMVISATETPGRRALYALLYTPFIWGKRDIEVTGPWYHHVNPSVGLVVSNVLEHALVGGSLDLFNGIVLTMGLHISHVSILNPQSGLAEGDVFTGGQDDLPIAKTWTTQPFVAVSIDLRAAVELFKSLVAASPNT